MITTDTITDLLPIKYHTTRERFDWQGLSKMVGSANGRWLLTGYSFEFNGEFITVTENWSHNSIDWNKDIYTCPSEEASVRPFRYVWELIRGILKPTNRV